MSDLDWHPLFLPEDGVSPEGFAPEPIMHIELIRSGHQGEIRIPRVFAPDELTSYEQIAELYGGGLYHVRARRHDGTYYAKRRVHLAGKPKPLDVETGAPAAAAPALSSPAVFAPAPSAPTHDPMFALLISQMQESQRAMTTIMAAAMTALAGRGESAADTMKTIVPLLAPLMQRPEPASAGAPLREVLEVSKLIRDEARAQADLQRDTAPAEPDDMAGQIRGIVEAVAPIMLSVASSTSGSGTGTP